MRKLPAAAQEERRRQVIGLRQAGMTYAAIAAQVGLTQAGVFDVCKRYAERGAAGLKTGPRGPEPGHGRFLAAEQEAEARDLIRRHTPDELDMPFALWSRAAVRELIWRRFGVRLAVRTMGTYLARWGFTALWGVGAQIAARGFGGAWDGSMGSASPVVWMIDALQGQRGAPPQDPPGALPGDQLARVRQGAAATRQPDGVGDAGGPGGLAPAQDGPAAGCCMDPPGGAWNRSGVGGGP